MTIAIGLALRATATTSIGVDLLGVELKPILERTGIRRALMVTAALCLVIGISLLAGLHIRLRLQEQQNASLKAAIRKEFEAVMPGVPIVDELRQLEERLKKVRKEYEAFAGVAQGHFSCVQVLADVGKRFPTGGKVFLRSLTISVPTVQLTGVADTVSAADEVRAALSESALFSEVRMNMVRLDKREGNVQFGITLTLREGWQRAADK